jgi:hypothetical protein
MKSLYEQFDGTYRKENDYLIPNLIFSSSEEINIGIYGERHLQYLQEFHRLTYINLLTSGVLNKYLSEIDKQAQERFCRIVKQLKTTQGITEQLKEDNSIDWIKRMNCICQQAEEIVIKELLHN